MIFSVTYHELRNASSFHFCVETLNNIVLDYLNTILLPDDRIGIIQVLMHGREDFREDNLVCSNIMFSSLHYRHNRPAFESLTVYFQRNVCCSIQCLPSLELNPLQAISFRAFQFVCTDLARICMTFSVHHVDALTEFLVDEWTIVGNVAPGLL